MKNQYFGDVGDFGKYGLLSALSSAEIKLGVNWYLTKDDNRTDGKFTEYLSKAEFVDSDPELADFLRGCIELGKRNVGEIKSFERFSDFEYHDEILDLKHVKALNESGRKKRIAIRTKWFEDSLEKLSGCHMIFCDPDNGIETKAMSKIGVDSVKYVLIDEIKAMIEKGHSLVIYNHRDRSSEEAYFSRFGEVKKQLSSEISLRVIRFNRYSARDYLVFIQDKHKNSLNDQIDKFLINNKWKRHFKEIGVK